MVYCLSLIVVLGLVWGIKFTSEKQDRNQILKDFYTTLIHSNLEVNENSAQIVYEQLKPLFTENSNVDLDKLSLILEPDAKDLNHYLALNTANISYEVGKESRYVSGSRSGFSIPVTIIVEAGLTDLVEQKEINRQKTITTELLFSKINNEWKVSDFLYIDDKALLAF